MFLGFSNLHKVFKCLDVSTGRVYVSRDFTFDEQVFPFATLHPNAGARLKAEISLLPSSLTNKETCDQEGEEHHDQMFNISMPNATNISCADSSCDASEGVPCRFGRLREASEDLAGESSLDSVQASALVQLQVQSSGSPFKGEQQLPIGHPAAATSYGGSTVPACAIIAPTANAQESHQRGSSVHTELVQQYEVMRPKTRLQSGIRKEKIYTDGIVRYSCFTSSREP